MGFMKKLLFWRRKRNVAITTCDIATQAIEPDKITDDCADKERKNSCTAEVSGVKGERNSSNADVPGLHGWYYPETKSSN